MTQDLCAAFERVFGVHPDQVQGPRGPEVDDPNLDTYVSDSEAELLQQRADDRTAEVFG